MQGNSQVIERMDAAYRVVKSVIEQAHIQEHWLEATGWKSLSKLWDCIETKGHEDILHPLMKRTNALGGKCTPRYAFEPAQAVDATQIDGALTSMVSRLNELRAAFITVCEVAERVDDYVTEAKIWDIQKLVEKFIRKCEKQLGKIAAVGMTEFLSEMVD